MNESISLVEEIAEMKNISHIESDDCFICGQKENSLIPYYAKRDSIGIIHWNSQSVSDTRVREYDDDGNEIFENKGMSMTINSFGESYGSVHIQEMAERGISEVSAYFSDDDTIDFEKAVRCANVRNVWIRLQNFIVSRMNMGMKVISELLVSP